MDMTIEIRSKEEYEEIINNSNLVLVYFSLSVWNVCHDIFPKVLEIARKHSINIARIDINKVKIVAGQSLIFTVPTILIMKESKEILRESRFIDFNNIDRVLQIVSEWW